MSGAWHVGADIGGTFTDVVAVAPREALLRTAKVRTRPGDPISSLDAALEAVRLGWEDVADLMHGTTLATNAIVEERLPPVALVTTEGFADTLAIGRQNRRELYRLDLPPKLPPLVPDALRLEVRERIAWDGGVLIPLEPAAVERLADEVGALGVSAVAVSLLNAFAHPAHEAALGARLAAAGRHVALSHELNPEAREYERSSVTVLNAALMPMTADYAAKLLDRAAGGTRLHLMHSAGGMASPEAVARQPLALALSGPAAGVAAAGRVSADLGLDQVISFDMGGTTTDVCLIAEGAAEIGRGRLLAGRPIRQPMVAVESIGAGGGSLARIEGGAIRVGPQSAGAEPGPACYGLGGSEATVTDANLLLGYLSDQRRLGGSIRPDRESAERAVGRLAEAFGVSGQEAALGIYRIANAGMARALRRVTVERGVDARRCTLLAFGGAGPMHAVELAREFGIRRVVVPRCSSVFSALGCLTAELSYARQRSVRMSSQDWDGARLEALRSELLAQLSAPLHAAGLSDSALRVEDVAAIRYAGQSDSVEVAYKAPAEAGRLAEAFKARHQQLYGFTTDEPWELESLRVKVSAPAQGGLAESPRGTGRGEAAPFARGPCWFAADAPRETPRFDREALGEGQRILGPAVIEDDWSTVVVPPGATAWTDGHGHLQIDVEARP